MNNVLCANIKIYRERIPINETTLKRPQFATAFALCYIKVPLYFLQLTVAKQTAVYLGWCQITMANYKVKRKKEHKTKTAVNVWAHTAQSRIHVLYSNHEAIISWLNQMTNTYEICLTKLQCSMLQLQHRSKICKQNMRISPSSNMQTLINQQLLCFAAVNHL